MNALSTPTTILQTTPIVRADEGFYSDLGDHRSLAKVTAADTNGALLMVRCEADFNGGVPPHIHHREDEIFYILSGRVEFMVGESIVEAGTGDTVFGPRDIPHAWRAVSPEGARLLITFTPGDNFQAFGMAMAEAGIAPLEAMTDANKAASFVELAVRHGIEMLPPGAIK